MASTITDTRAQLGRAGAEGTRSRSALDLATVVGLGGAFALIITAMILGGSPGSFIDLPSIMIVIGGTFGVTTVCFSLSEVIEAQRILLKVLARSARNPSEAAVQVLELAVTARKNGVLALQNVLHTIESERRERALPPQGPLHGGGRPPGRRGGPHHAERSAGDGAPPREGLQRSA
jgi:hypothetical protein